MLSQYRRDLILPGARRNRPLAVTLALPLDEWPRAVDRAAYNRLVASDALDAGERPSEWFTPQDYGAAPLHGNVHAALKRYEEQLEVSAHQWHMSAAGAATTGRAMPVAVLDTRRKITAKSDSVVRMLVDASAATFASSQRPAAPQSAGDITERLRALLALEQAAKSAFELNMLTLNNAVLAAELAASDARIRAALAAHALAELWQREFLDGYLAVLVRELSKRRLNAHGVTTAPHMQINFARETSALLVSLWNASADALAHFFPAASATALSSSGTSAYRSAVLQAGAGSGATSVQRSYTLYAHVVRAHIGKPLAPIVAPLSGIVDQWLGKPPSVARDAAVSTLRSTIQQDEDGVGGHSQLSVEHVHALLISAPRHYDYAALDTSHWANAYRRYYGTAAAPSVAATAASTFSAVVSDDDEQQQQQFEPDYAASLALPEPRDNDGDYYGDDDAAPNDDADDQYAWEL